MHYRPMVLAITGTAATLLLAPTAVAAPECTQIDATTTQCQTPGHSQITTSPPAMNFDHWWPYGGYAVGFPW